MLPQLQPETSSVTTPAPVRWSLATRIGFRFVFCYFFLYISPGPVGTLGVGEKVTSYRAVLSGLWSQIVPWVGAGILGVKERLVEIPNGSGDQLYDWILIALMAVIAAIVTVIWSVLDRKRENYEQLNQWLRLFMRLVVAATMMSYGVSKLLPTQFSDIKLSWLVDPLGHFTPMGLLWGFMGYSRAYQIFGGAAEFLGGVLLVFPRFATAGALVSLGVLSNVLMLNLCYDVPRKIFTIHLVLICLFLAMPDTQRILNLFILNRPTTPRRTIPFLKDKQLNRGVIVLQYLYGAACLLLAFQGSYAPALQNEARLAAPLRGIWNVEAFSSKDPAVDISAEKQRWRRVIFDAPDALTIQPFQGTLHLYALKVEPGQKRMTYAEFGQALPKGTFLLEGSTNDQMQMNGEIDGHPVDIALRRVDMSDPNEFVLPHREFRWVTPAPRWH